MDRLASAVLSLAFAAVALAAEPPVGYVARADARVLMRELVAEHGFSRAELERVFRAARAQPRIIALMDRPLLVPPKWFEYAPPFLSPERVAAGVAYWRAHAALLGEAEARYGVPPEIIIGILGVETFYGRFTGKYRVLDALATLAFDYPRRAPFFRGELKEFLLLAREQQISPLVPTGSFAGAIGVPQFMPGSYRHYAVDFDGDGRVDLWHSNADVIGSVANYLARHDWRRGGPVLLPATLAPEAHDALRRRLDGGVSERRALDAWRQDGVRVDGGASDPGPDPVAVLMLEEAPDYETYWIACQNFYVLTRYNRSRLYATAVWQLGQAVRAVR